MNGGIIRLGRRIGGGQVTDRTPAYSLLVSREVNQIIRPPQIQSYFVMGFRVMMVPCFFSQFTVRWKVLHIVQ